MATMNSERQGGFTASADCTGKQYSFAAISGARTATFVGTAGAIALGVIGNKPNTGQAMEILIGPEVKITLSATLTAGAKVSSNNAGLAKAAATGENILGQLVEGGAVNEVVAMIFEPQGLAP